MTLLAQAPQGSLRYTFQWADGIPSNASLQSVAYEIAGGTIVNEFIDAQAKTSTIQINDIQHGSVCQVRALATLSNSELLPDQQLVVRGFNG